MISGSGTSVAYIISLNAAGTAWGEVNFGGVPNGYSPVSVATVAGLPAFLGSPNSEDLLYFRAEQSTGDTWSSDSLVDDLEKVDSGAGPKLLDVAGLPAAFYDDDVMGSLKYRRARDVNGTTWEPPVVLDSRASGFVAPFVADGRPCALYTDRISHALMFIAANDSGGSYWGIPSVVDALIWDVGGSGNRRTETIGVAEIGHQPAFAYRHWREDGAPPEDPVQRIAFVMYR